MPRILSLFALFVLGLGSPLLAQEAPKEKLPMVAVLPLDARGLTSEEGTVMTEMLGSELLQTGAFRVMERSQMDKILAEQGFQKSGACDNSQCAVEMGQLLGIERMVVGSIGKVGRTFLVSVRMVNVGSGEILKSVSRTTTGDVEDILTRMLPIVASELANKPVDVARHPLIPPGPPQAQAKVDSAPPVKAPVQEAKIEKESSSWGGLLLGTVLLAGAGGGAWYFLAGPGSESSEEKPGEATSSTRTAVFSWNP